MTINALSQWKTNQKQQNALSQRNNKDFDTILIYDIIWKFKTQVQKKRNFCKLNFIVLS